MQFKQQYKESEYTKDDWETPDYIYNVLDSVFRFNLDPAANHDNTKCLMYFTEEENGLEQPWREYNSQVRVFVNPPYTNGSYSKWISKAVEEYRGAHNMIIVMLLPASWETKAFEPVWNWARYIIFPYKRIKFELGGESVGGAPFSSLIPIFMNTTLSDVGIGKLGEIGRVVDLLKGYKLIGRT